MKNKLTYFLGFVFVFFSLVTCKHKCEKDPDSVLCPGCCEDQSLQGMKDYFFFKTGTWWVYREENTGELDTVTVFYDFEGVVGGEDYFEWYDASTYFQYNFYHVFNGAYNIFCHTDKDCECRKLSREKAKPGDYVGGGRYFTYPIIKGNLTNDGGQSVVSNYYDNWTVANTNFSSVAEFDVYVDRSTINTGSHTKYWWAKNVGVIEFQNLDNDLHWKLVNSYIIQ